MKWERRRTERHGRRMENLQKYRPNQPGPANRRVKHIHTQPRQTQTDSHETENRRHTGRGQVENGPPSAGLDGVALL